MDRITDYFTLFISWNFETSFMVADPVSASCRPEMIWVA